MIKLQDFARQCGCSDRNLQKHLKKYAKELEGLYERRGSNGTWLSDEACDFLRTKMKAQTMVVYDDALERRIKELEAAKKELQDDNERIRKERDKAQDDLFAAKQIITGLQEKEVLYLEEKSRAEELQKQLERPLTWKERWMGKRVLQ